MKSINKTEIRVIALRRSGQHAIINWILKQIKGKVVFLNNCLPGTNPYANYSKRDSFVSGIDLNKELKGKFSKKDYLIYNYEDCRLKDILNKKFERNHDEWVGDSSKQIDIILLRDAFNLFASKLRWSYGKKKEYTPTLRSIIKLRKTWKNYAKEFIGETSHFKNKLIVNYNLWVSDKKYRKNLSKRLGLCFNDKGFNEVAKYGPNYLFPEEDSFDGMKFDGKAKKMKVLERWKYFVNDEFFRYIFTDKKLVSLSNRIFGNIKGTNILLQQKGEKLKHITFFIDPLWKKLSSTHKLLFTDKEKTSILLSAHPNLTKNKIFNLFIHPLFLISYKLIPKLNFISKTYEYPFKNKKSKHKDPITIVTTSDDTYVTMLAAMLKSLMTNYKGQESIHIYVIDNGIEESNKNKLLKSIKLKKIKLTFVRIDSPLLKKLKIQEEDNNLETYYYNKLLMPYFLPKKTNKVLFLDSDMIILDDIRKLWNKNFEGTILLATQNAAFPTNIKDGIKNYKELGLNPESKYFNSGVMLINLKKWREKKISEQVIKVTKSNRKYETNADQYGLNVVLTKFWDELNPSWNQLPYTVLKGSPHIMHYVWKKPIFPNYDFDFKRLFFHYLDMTLWKGWRPTSVWKTSLSKYKSKYKKLISLLKLCKIDSTPIPNSKKEIRLFVKVRNESLRLPYFFKYYFDKGVDRIFLIDNNSEDDTITTAISQENVHVFKTNETFHNSWNWMELLLKRYGKDNWCVVVDADELLNYPHADKISIKDLCKFLDQEKYTALRCLILDMYSNNKIKLTKYKRGGNPISICPYFDTEYNKEKKIFTNKDSLRNFEFKIFKGGMRKRVFNIDCCLSKVPLFKNTNPYLTRDVHAINNAVVADIQGTLLHFKYFSDFISRAKEEAIRKEHWQKAIEYEAYSKKVKKHPDIKLYYNKSKKIINNHQLVKLKIMKSSKALDNFVKR